METMCVLYFSCPRPVIIRPQICSATLVFPATAVTIYPSQMREGIHSFIRLIPNSVLKGNFV